MLAYAAEARVYAASAGFEVDGALRRSSYAGALHNPRVTFVITVPSLVGLKWGSLVSSGPCSCLGPWAL